MTVEELIKVLEKIEDKKMNAIILNNSTGCYVNVCEVAIFGDSKGKRFFLIS